MGSIIGDGNLYDNKSHYVEITGNKETDRPYFEVFLSELVKRELDYSPRISFRSNSIRLRINNKAFVEWLKIIGIPAGRGKFKKVSIPKDILNDSKENLKACLRGIFDTDGCVSFDKRKTYKKTIHSDSTPYVEQ